MKTYIVTHNAFDLYWPERLSALSRNLEGNARLFLVSVFPQDPIYKKYSLLDYSLTDISDKIDVLFPTSAFREYRGRSNSHIWSQLVGKYDLLMPDAILAPSGVFPPGAAAIYWARTRHRGVAIMDNARIEDLSGSSITRRFRILLHSEIDAALIPAETHLSGAIALGMPSGRIFYGLNSIDEKRIGGWAKGEDIMLGDIMRKKYFITAGRQTRKKNLDILLRSYGKYRRRIGKDAFSLLLVGNGPSRTKLEDIVVEHNIKGVFFLDTVERQKLAAIIAKAEAFVLSSVWGETWGNVVAEAAACGVPLIVSEQAGCAQTLVKKGVNGYRFNPESVNELADVLVAIHLERPDTRRKMGEKSRELAKEWSVHRFAQGATDALTAAAEHGKGRGFSSGGGLLVSCGWRGQYYEE